MARAKPVPRWGWRSVRAHAVRVMKDYGILQVYTGDGKGKTSAALGVAFRACARGARVLMLAFLKDDPNYSEAIGAHLLPGFTLKQVGTLL